MISLSNSVPQYILPAAGLALPLVSAPLFTQAVRISTVGGWVRGGGSSVWLLATFRSVNFSDICRLLSPLIGEGNSYTVSAMVWLPLPPPPPPPHPIPSPQSLLLTNTRRAWNLKRCILIVSVVKFKYVIIIVQLALVELVTQLVCYTQRTVSCFFRSCSKWWTCFLLRIKTKLFCCYFLFCTVSRWNIKWDHIEFLLRRIVAFSSSVM